MRLSRARRLSSECNRCQGAKSRVGRLQHLVAGPANSRTSARAMAGPWAELPLPHRVVDARLEPLLLLLVAHLEPVFDQPDAVVDDVLLEFRADLEEQLVLLLGAKAHDVLNAGAVVPAAVEDHDFAGRGEMRQVALHVHLRLFTVRRRRQRDHAEDARADALGDRPDRPALAGGVAALEHDDDPLALCLDPVLQDAEFGLQLARGLLVVLPLQLRRAAVGDSSCTVIRRGRLSATIMSHVAVPFGSRVKA